MKLILPSSLRNGGGREDRIPLMAEKAMEDWWHAFNSRPCSKDDMTTLYLDAYETIVFLALPGKKI